MAKLLITKKEDIDKIIDLYQSGISCTKIEISYNVTTNTISSVLKRAGIDVVNRQNMKRYTIEDIVKDYCELGMSLTQISKKYNSFLSKYTGAILILLSFFLFKYKSYQVSSLSFKVSIFISNDSIILSSLKLHL